MTATQAAKTRPAADPLAEAELDQEAARSAVQRLTVKLKEIKQGATADPILVTNLESEREDALKVLRRVDLEAAEQTAAAGAPISTKALGKIRDMRQRAETLHAGVMARTGECQRLRERAGGLKNEIAALKDSWEFKLSHQDYMNPYLRPPRDPQLVEDRSGPPRSSEKTPKAVEKLAQLERDLETTGAELTLATAAQVAASERWHAEKRVLDGWEKAVRRLGPAARAVLDALPLVGAQSLGEVARQVDFRNGVPGFTQPMIRGG